MTQTSSTAASTGLDYIARPESCGPALPVNDVRCRLDEEGNDVAEGQAGELWVTALVKGYWNKPEATAETFVAGSWLRTGDIARVDPEGFIYHRPCQGHDHPRWREHLQRRGRGYPVDPRVTDVATRHPPRAR